MKQQEEQLRIACRMVLARMNNVVALREVRLEGLEVPELRALLVVLRGAEDRISRAERRARQPWSR